MADMNDLRLPLPNPHEWITTEGAAELLDMSRRQVARVVANKGLAGYYPRGGKDEKRPLLLWLPEVERYGEARRLVRQGQVSRA